MRSWRKSNVWRSKLTATRVDIVIEQGAPLNQTIYVVRDANGNVVDLSQATGSAHFKINYTSNTFIAANVSFDQNGSVILTADQTTMAGFDQNYSYVYDVYSTINGANTKLVWGVADVIPSVTMS